MRFFVRSYRPLIMVGVLAGLSVVVGCESQTSGDSKDFGPVDTSKAATKSEAAKVFPGFGKNDPAGHPNQTKKH